MATIVRVTSSPPSDERLRDLAVMRRVKDRIDREYAQPLDVDALARGVHMSSGHLSRQFKAAYGESPYSYLMTRRIERAMALLRIGELSVTDVCFAVGCQSLGTFSTRFTELVGRAAERLPRAGGRRDARDPGVRGQAGDPAGAHDAAIGRRIGQEWRSPGRGAATSVSAMDITIHHSFLPHTDPDASRGVLSRHPRLRGPHGRRLRRHALDHRRARPTSPTPPSCCTRRRPRPASPTRRAGPCSS